MDALRLGTFVISAPRFYAAVALLALVGAAELTAWRTRRRQPANAGWAWNAAGAVLLGARLGFVLENLGYFLGRPLEAIAFWQGGFSPWWGVAAGAATALWAFRRRWSALWPAAAVPTTVALATWLLLPPLLTAAGEEAVVTLPPHRLQSLTGATVDLSTLAEDGPVVVNAWATWCLPCRRELPQLARAAAENPGVRFVLLNQGEAAGVVEAFLDAHPTVERSSVLLDPRLEAGTHLGGVGLPTTYFFAVGGEHRSTHVGEISGAALRQAVRRLTTP